MTGTNRGNTRGCSCPHHTKLPHCGGEEGSVERESWVAEANLLVSQRHYAYMDQLPVELRRALMSAYGPLCPANIWVCWKEAGLAKALAVVKYYNLRKARPNPAMLAAIPNLARIIPTLPYKHKAQSPEEFFYQQSRQSPRVESLLADFD